MARRSPTPDPDRTLQSVSDPESIGDIGTMGMLNISSSPENGTPAHSDLDPTSPTPNLRTPHSPMALLPGPKQKLGLMAEGQDHCPHPPQ